MNTQIAFHSPAIHIDPNNNTVLIELFQPWKGFASNSALYSTDVIFQPFKSDSSLPCLFVLNDEQGVLKEISLVGFQISVEFPSVILFDAIDYLNKNFAGQTIEIYSNVA